jgi:hypothetical protein
MSVAPIFKFRNVRKKLSSTSATILYGVVTGTDGIGTDYSPDQVSAVVLTIQIANSDVSAPVSATLFVTDGSIGAVSTTETLLVKDYPVPPRNAFDPLSGNLVLTDGLRIYAQAATADKVEIVMSLLEIANAAAS